MLRAALTLSIIASTSLWSSFSHAGEVPLSSLDLTKLHQGWGEPQVDQSVEKHPLSIGGQGYEHGVGSHAGAVMYVDAGGTAERFTAFVGVDDECKERGSIVFRVYGDGHKLFDSGVMKGGDRAKPVDVDLTGVKIVLLVVGSAGDGIDHDHGDWADATFRMKSGTPRTIDPPTEEKVILTPKPAATPHINGPKVFGVRPGKPFIYRIPCTGERPITFAADNLPSDLKLDAQTGIITGTTPRDAGKHKITFRAKSKSGENARDFTLVAGDTLALTPPMGWNSWYIFYNRVTDADLRATADAFLTTGLADFGYMYVDVDDCWMKKKGDQPYRDEQGAVLPNAKFPDMKALTEYIHSKGLRAGLYTSPGPWTCAGYIGAHEHEEADARRFAEWGFDFLKYDWCSYEGVATGDGDERFQRPYRQMGDILKTLDRDIVLNLCQYGMGDVWKWGGDVGGQCWRTTGDLGNEQGGLLPGFYEIGLSNARHAEFARPGRWNDPDYLMLGRIGDTGNTGVGQMTTLTGNEQYSYMSMWCLMAAPLFLSGDATKLDDFTLNVLCNAEVIDIDQDPLGRQARIVRQTEDELIMAKPLEDGSVAVGLFNLSEFERPVSVTLKELEITGTPHIRDLWRQKDIGTAVDKVESKLPRHAVALLRLTPKP